MVREAETQEEKDLVFAAVVGETEDLISLLQKGVSPNVFDKVEMREWKKYLSSEYCWKRLRKNEYVFEREILTNYNQNKNDLDNALSLHCRHLLPLCYTLCSFLFLLLFLFYLLFLLNNDNLVNDNKTVQC